MNKLYQLKQQRGFTMIEVLVAMTLGLVVLGSAIGMQVSHRKGFKLTESKLTMQTNAKFAFEFIASNLKELGSAGCRTVAGYYGNASADDPDLEHSNYEIAFNNKQIAFADFRLGREVLGYENSEGSTVWTPSVSGDFSFVSDMLDGSDAITMRGAIGRSYRVDPDELSGSKDNIQLDMANVGYVALKPNHYAVLSQCDHAEVFKITGADTDVSAGKISHGAGALGDDNATSTFIRDLDLNAVAELRRVAVSTYYIAENDNGIPTLYRDIDNISDPLVEGVERMQIEYGINTNDTATRHAPDVYQTADWVELNNRWPDVVSVRLSFIMRSKEEVYEQDATKTYRLPGTAIYSYTPTDKYSRLIYTSTVQLRNRAIGLRTN